MRNGVQSAVCLGLNRQSPEIVFFIIQANHSVIHAAAAVSYHPRLRKRNGRSSKKETEAWANASNFPFFMCLI